MISSFLTKTTVIDEYISALRNTNIYQSETDLENHFINLLSSQGYDYLPFHTEPELINNLRCQLELLNNITFSDNEWERFFKECLAKQSDGIVEKTRKIQFDHIQILKRDDGSTKNIYLLDKKNINNNISQVINQYNEFNGIHKTRYDVTVLINGLPLVHIELKRRGTSLRDAFNQIQRYQRDSFWASSGLYEYIQIFVISNGTNTKYYSNTTRLSHIYKLGETERCGRKKTSNSFEFTSYWSDANNKAITKIEDFTTTFFNKISLLNIITRYCVFTYDELLLVMRPYQIVAIERIISRIIFSTDNNKTGTIDAGGYIWHTTGSGKTLTSFKTAQLVTSLNGIDKVLFVVDRKDLDYQTMKEYDRFERGAANSNASTKILQNQLEDDNVKIIITTIQKLDVFMNKNKTHNIFMKHIVIIFDECHRSQFGEMHHKITKAFNNYHIFGFTGTPIFANNANNQTSPQLRTTSQAFGDKLHTYTVVDAINDENVLPFRVDFINTLKQKDEIKDNLTKTIDTENALSSPERIQNIVKYIIEHFEHKTYRNQKHSIYFHKIITNVGDVSAGKTTDAVKIQHVNGFNSILATSSIAMAMRYYSEFKSQLTEINSNLVVATIYSFSANEAESEDIVPDESFDNDKLDKTSRDFLEAAILDYNNHFGTNYDTSSDKFQNYYKDLSLRMKNREIDLLIVVNMFLTGFDATTLNTLWVDKYLKHHGLMQAFSRTNRVLNSVKIFGNIVSFRNLQKETDEAIAMFGNKNSNSIVLLKSFSDYYNGYEQNGNYYPGYAELISKLQKLFPLENVILGERSQKEFIRLFGQILRFKNILKSFDNFVEYDLISIGSFQDYQSIYIDLYNKFRKIMDNQRENINDDILFELELIKQIDVNVDYILSLIEKYHASNCEDDTINIAIDKAINSSIELRSKKELIKRFIEHINLSTKDIFEEWPNFIQKRLNDDLNSLIEEENLKGNETRRFINIACYDGILKTTGTSIDKLLPPASRFGSDNRIKKKQTVIEKLKQFYFKYYGLV
ncbi:MAG: type I restriction endonuclease subunit R [Deltaproteobacteria bacterium]|jgi:type I restriction enzyme R subunit|nr:type I restriction endonuclease subunit R [Deltaproteobacteria bacterium]